MQRGYHSRGLRFLPKLGLAITIGLITAAACYATDVYTDPVGFITITANGSTGVTGTPYSLWGLGLTQVPVVRGLVSSAPAGAQVPLSVALTAGAYNAGSEGPLYFIEFYTNNTENGLMDDIVSNDGVSVTTATDDHLNIANGAGFKIYPHWTFASLFGANNSAGFVGAGSSASADNILVPNQSTQKLVTYFYYTGTKHGGPNWEDSGNNDATNVRIWIDQGIWINKITTTNLLYKLVGAVKLGPTSIPIGGTNTYVANVYATSAMTLGSSGLETGNPLTGLVGAGSSASADDVLIHNDATGHFTTYFYYTGTKHGGPNWEDSGNNDATNVQLPLGACVEISLTAGHNGFQWQAPAPY